MFNLFKKLISKDIIEQINTMDEISFKKETIKENTTDEEWIWIEGYKGTDEDMKCYDFQYEIGGHHIYNEEVELCRKGFHFCTMLGDVFGYYNIDFNNRFFKVKGLVKKSDHYKRYSTSSTGFDGFYITPYSRDSKIVAKEIIFLEELTYDDLKEYIKDRYPFIETKEEYYNCKNYEDFTNAKFLREMNNLGFSDTYSIIQFDKRDKANLFYYLQRAKSYKAENISKDLMVYLLETK